MVSGLFIPADFDSQKKPSTEASAEESHVADLRILEEQAPPKTDLEVWQRRSHRFHHWPEKEDIWYQPGRDVVFTSFPTHIRPFKSHEEYELVQQTFEQLQHGSFYWGSMSMEEAHKILSDTPEGTFLIRDSCQPDVFFTLSYQREDGPTSVRIRLKNLLFNLCGSQKTFASLFALLAFYSSSNCKLKSPYRKQRPEYLKQICRRALIETYGARNISALPGLSGELRDFVHAYPYCI